MIIDSHVHTHYSHGDSEVYRLVLEGIKKGLDGIGFSEHFHYDFFSDLGLPTVSGNIVNGTKFDDFKLYYNAVNQAKLDFGSKIKIHLGVEIDYLKSKSEQIKESLNIQPYKNDYKEKNPNRKFEFDFIMGATHFIGEPLKYFSDYKDKGDDWMINEYFDSIEHCIKSEIFDIIAHSEIIKYFIDKDFTYYRKRVESVVNLLSEYNVAIDINTDYMINPDTKKLDIERINPGIEMLKMCNDKNIVMVLGSDAHSPDKLAKHFNFTIDFLKTIGIKQLYYFKDRKAISYEI